MAQAIAAPLPPPRRTLMNIAEDYERISTWSDRAAVGTPHRAFYDQATQLLRTQMTNLAHENEEGGDDDNVDNDNVNDDNLGIN